MTVTYGGRVPNGSTFGCFWKVLGIWRGSVYKLVWRELLAYLSLYYTINLIYRFALTEPQQRIFERIRLYFGQQSETIPMSFVLGFYVSLVVSRWWDQYKLLPWPDTLALFLNAGIPGANERHRLMRRNIVRYAVLAYVITLQRVSLRVKKRFPTWQHVVDSGLMLESERKIFELMDQRTPMSKYWMPLVWATNIINRARKESIITSDHIVQTLLMELSDIRRKLGALIGYDTVNVPLVYTQVVSLALYTYFLAALLGRQFVEGPQNKFEAPDMYFPFFTSLQFCFYVGWLKVAEVLINPFGEDDDDIELNWLIDRHIKASYMIVDEMHEEHPELLKDQYWDDVVPKDLPYTVASEHYRRQEPKCSADSYKIKAQDAVYANLIAPKKSLLGEDMYADYESVDTPIQERRKSSNWFSRQISRTGMGSIRSSSTAYSSGGLFARYRGNSVYANPENGQLPGMPTHKMSIYDRLVGRKSGRSKSHRPNLKLSGAAAMQIKNRPRIPTPDVTKEVVDRENRLAASVASVQNQMSAGLTLMPHQIQAGYATYPSGDIPVVQVCFPNPEHCHWRKLSFPLEEVVVGLTSHHNSPLLARTSFDHASIRNPAFIQAFEPEKPLSPNQPLTLTEVQPDEELQVFRSSNGTPSSEDSHASKDSTSSNVSATTASVTSKTQESTSDSSKVTSPFIFDTLPVTLKLTPIAERKIVAEATLIPSASAPNSLVSLGGGGITPSNENQHRKVSSISQSGQEGGTSKREVYV
ncbi:bestrophin family protein [Leptinotarsa decemlineata]|uniref:bestrophin family protein n=1 Tax=Leptinotarsa decemlineata TaxID=7539 RepID=UPI003D30582E